MYDEPLLVKALADLTRTLMTPYEVKSAMDELTSSVTEVLGLAGSGVSLAREGRLELATTHGFAIADVERIQERAQVGPGMSAHATGMVVTVTDLGARIHQWPAYCAASAAAGISSVASLPMQPQAGGQVVGALTLYADGPRVWADEDVAAAAVMTGMAGVGVIHAAQHRRQVELAEQLQRALDSRVIIEQAKGVLIARHRIAAEQAFERLRRYARNRSVTVASVADAVVKLRLDPSD